MSNVSNQPRDRFQLAWRHTSVKIKARGREYPLETRLHFIHYDKNMLLNILYLTSLAPTQESWIVGFDPIADKVCPFNSKLEVTTALNCFLDSAKFTEIFDPSIDISSCRSLVHKIACSPEVQAKEALRQLCNMLNINVLAGESAMGNDSPVESVESSPIMQQEALSFKLTIGSQELTDGLLSLLRIGGQQAEDTLLLTLNIKATSNLSKVDYNDDIRLSLDVGQGVESIFGGKISEAQCSNNDELGLTCRSFAIALEDTIIPSLVMRVSGAQEKLYFILRGSGWQPEQLSIDGLDVSGRMRFYLVLNPLANIEADEPFGIGDVNFVKLEQEQKDVLKSLNPESYPNFPNMDEDKIWAKVYVPAPHFYEAQFFGIEKIDIALDLLSDVKSDSKPFHFSDKGYLPVSWRRSDRFRRVIREPWVYIQDLATKEDILANIDFIIEGTKLGMTPSLKSRLEKGTKKLQILFQKPWEDLNSREKGLVHALHWLHRAWDEGTGVDKLMYLWNAIEFISAAGKPLHLFSREEIKSINKLAHNGISNEDPNKDLKVRRLDELLAMLNNPSLLAQLNQLIESEGISVSEEEREHIKKSRRKRNDIIHGKSDVSFDDNEATKLSFIVSKIISGLASKL